MRVIAGYLGGRIFQSPNSARTHPMSDKMRGALFNILGDIEGYTVLDPFSGTGALAYESISRGAKQVVAIEQDRSAQRTINDNMKNLGISDNMQLIKAGAGAWLKTSTDVFDIILLDPPYDDVQLPLLQELSERISTNGQLVLSWPGKIDPPAFDGYNLVRSKGYGDGSLHVYDHTVV
ncbi:16S rRNA (guanine(966)-N(2))-methyltransferase RsmD [soil metagenome]